MGNKKNSTAKMHFACAIVFIIFVYCYLAFYQADVLAVAQHVLSDGKTDYSYTVAPLLITLVLYVLQLGVYALTQVKRRFHALTYFPSFLILTIITDIPTDVDIHHSLGAWWIVAPLCLLAFAGAVWVIRQLEPLEQEPHSSGWLSKYMWINLFQMVAMIVVMSFVASNDRLFHERMKMERLMKQKNYAEALKVGRKSLQTDSSLTMLRIACLHHTGELADKLFSYPLVGGSKAMLPDSVTVKSLMWRSHRWMQEPTDSMKMQHLVYRKPDDYKLCALLLDKKLDQFVVALCKHYDVKTAKLPTHYKEALTLYIHRRSKPVIEYHDNVVDTDFQDYQQMEHKYTNRQEMQTAIRDTYGNTYWYYFDYCSK